MGLLDCTEVRNEEDGEFECVDKRTVGEAMVTDKSELKTYVTSIVVSRAEAEFVEDIVVDGRAELSLEVGL